ncbi:DUF6221 family protein [Streptomyces acidiscabies]|uniref:DUF6221 family protein n=1 Tax=Streptomyces acidiscabies TaxID=42234 RepID=UPI000951872F|nr:DUF6221 family protein [Streptomyces acidiscabies]
MDDLATWLRACLDEDERLAREATAGPWSRMGQRVLDPSPPSDRLGIGMAVGHAAATADFNETAEHIAEHDPARVLREVDAKRRIVAEHPAGAGWDGRDVDGLVCRTCAEDSSDGGRSGDPFPCTTLRLLALPYADRPGYREEWRP